MLWAARAMGLCKQRRGIGEVEAGSGVEIADSMALLQSGALVACYWREV